MRKLAFIVLAIPLITPPASAQDPYAVMDTTMAERYDHLTPALAHQISEAARHHQIPYLTAFGLVSVESDFIPSAVSWAGAIGLTQVMPPTGWEHCRLTPHGLRHSSVNLHCGFSYLRMLYDRLGSWHEALASYNVGPARRLQFLAGRTSIGGDGYAQRVLGIN